ncbi:rhomboid family intramembrane serine protease [Ponticaulis sp.]|uniref:rhomboid family intramembrane serine protease n=1 Tax=Ponticaulis sp. TaxID=2020902 RepID=UPI0025F5D6C3|nr:rhomboid family intramembrane serine protease [Ponticaulis sp.]
MEGILASRAALIFLVANLAISIYAFSNENFLRWGLLNTRAVLKQQEYHRILVSGFLHADPMHLFFNMITLFFFGPTVESIMGSQGFFLVYLGALVGGNLFALWRNRNDGNYSALGASGAISGILFTFCLFAPFAMILVLVVPVPAILYAFLFVAVSIYGMGRANNVIAHDAHLGGAVIGLIIAILVQPSLLPHFLQQLGGILG